MKYACQYAIVRFLPYVETGEFANVGIVIHCLQTGTFQYKLLDRVRRISAFFEELDIAVYRRSRTEFTAELDRISQIFRNTYAHASDKVAKNLFSELTRTREAMIRFDKPRVVMTDDPAEQLQKLFDHYVGRSFATKAYQEQLIEKQVRSTLRAANLSAIYKDKILGNDAYHARFPFVRFENGDAVRAIKPLHLAQDEPTQIFDHGWEWVGKVRKLRSENLLPPAVLFAVQGPDVRSKERDDAFNEIVSELTRQNVRVIAYNRTTEIVEFAR